MDWTSLGNLATSDLGKAGVYLMVGVVGCLVMVLLVFLILVSVAIKVSMILIRMELNQTAEHHGMPMKGVHHSKSVDTAPPVKSQSRSVHPLRQLKQVLKPPEVSRSS